VSRRQTNLDPQSQLSWVIGRRGLLGQSVESALALNSNLWHPLDPIRWLRRDGGASDLRDAVGQFLVAAGNDPWVIAWCAGAGTSSATPESLQLELVALRETLNSLDGATRPSEVYSFLLLLRVECTQESTRRHTMSVRLCYHYSLWSGKARG